VLLLIAMRVIPLGTSSGKPTLRRNVSGLAVARDGDWVLFDCGEGTQTQIVRAGLSPSRLSAIFITHLHGDHFNGLSGLLSTMGLDRRTRELTIAGPTGIKEYLELLQRLKVAFLTYPADIKEFDSVPRPIQLFETNGYTVTGLGLDHRLFAIGYRIEERARPGRFNVDEARRLEVPEGPMWGQLQSGQDVIVDSKVVRSSDVLGPPRPGKSVAYCLDTRPCEMSVELARGVDLLIHEATYTDEYSAEAQLYGHSTAAQAALIAQRAEVGKLLLTHFSSRFSDPAPLLEEARRIFPNTILADDLIEIEV
jgi:ribonuclease Z